MRPKHRVGYWLSSRQYWWQRGKWVHDDAIDFSLGASSVAHAQTKKQAQKIARRCPDTVYVSKWFLNHGHRYMKDYVLEAKDARHNDV